MTEPPAKSLRRRIVSIVPFTRRRFRHWRGRCVNCNYDLRANTTSVCPECGALVNDKTP